MNYALAQIVTIMFVHFVGDFILQTHWQATNKSKNLNALSRHVATYSACLAIGAYVIFGASLGLLWFALANAILHFATDFVTSKFTTIYFSKGDYHNGFAVVGFDQWIHFVCLVVTARFWLI